MSACRRVRRRTAPAFSKHWPLDLFRPMPQRLDVNPISEHSLYLRLFVTNSGGV
jgi:hypothetical protein